MTTGTDQTPRPADAMPPVPRRLVTTRIGWTWVALSSLAIAVFAIVPYLTASLADLSDAGVGLADNYDGRPAVVQAAFYAHIVAGGLALVAGPFQFWRGLRDRHRSVHRWIGRTYLAAVAIAGVSGLVMAPFSEAGFAGFEYWSGFHAPSISWMSRSETL